MQMFTLSPTLLSVLRKVGAVEEVYSWDQIVQYLKKYILNNAKKMTNTTDRFQINMEDHDPLSQVFGVRTFRLQELSYLIAKLVVPVCRQGVSVILKKDVTPSVASKQSTPGLKRKRASTDEDEAGKPGSSISRSSPMFLYLPPTPAYDSGAESFESIQEYSTVSAKDTSDTSDGGGFFPDPYAFEYENETLPSDNSMTTETEFVHSSIETLQPESDSDILFWGDRSNDEGQPKENAECELHHVASNPCEMCFEENISSLSKTVHKKKISTRKLKPKLTSSQETDKSSQSLADSDNNCIEETTTPSPCSDGEELCTNCKVSPANAAFIHGRTAHDFPAHCYKCAKELQTQKKGCPECSRTINKVVRIM